MLGSAHRALREASQHALPHLLDAGGEAWNGMARHGRQFASAAHHRLAAGNSPDRLWLRV
jgi:hypothetical protein